MHVGTAGTKKEDQVRDTADAQADLGKQAWRPFENAQLLLSRDATSVARCQAPSTGTRCRAADQSCVSQPCQDQWQTFRRSRSVEKEFWEVVQQVSSSHYKPHCTLPERRIIFQAVYRSAVRGAAHARSASPVCGVARASASPGPRPFPARLSMKRRNANTRQIEGSLFQGISSTCRMLGWLGLDCVRGLATAVKLGWSTPQAKMFTRTMSQPRRDIDKCEDVLAV